MTDWTQDERGRPVLVDTDTGTRYRITPAKGGDGWELAVFLRDARRSCDRRPFASRREAMGHAEARIENDREERRLGRSRVPARVATPWGQSRWATSYGDGIVLYSTSDNDGFRLSRERNLRIPEAVRNHDGWYQEESQGCIVALSFPDEFTVLERREAWVTLTENFPGATDVLLDPDGTARAPSP
jgi:hypothetical protein